MFSSELFSYFFVPAIDNASALGAMISNNADDAPMLTGVEEVGLWYPDLVFVPDSFSSDMSKALRGD